MEIDPIKRSLDEIEEELESALANLNATNQRVDDLLAEYGAGDPLPRTPATPIQDEAPAAPDHESDEPAPEY